MSEDRIAQLEARLKELEDVRAIVDLFHKWHYECTGGFAGKQAGRMEALECLTEDATILLPNMFKPGEEPKGIKEFTEFWEYFYGDAGPLPYVFQTSVSDKVVVTGDLAEHKTNMLGIFAFRLGQEFETHPVINLAQRTNYLRRTPKGWRIYKTTIEGGFDSPLTELRGALNPLPPMEERQSFRGHANTIA
jgi:hypothetical protein